MTPSVAEVLTTLGHVRQDVLIQSGILSLVKSLYNSSWVNTPLFMGDHPKTPRSPNVSSVSVP